MERQKFELKYIEDRIRALEARDPDDLSKTEFREVTRMYAAEDILTSPFEKGKEFALLEMLVKGMGVEGSYHEGGIHHELGANRFSDLRYAFNKLARHRQLPQQFAHGYNSQMQQLQRIASHRLDPLQYGKKPK